MTSVASATTLNADDVSKLAVTLRPAFLKIARRLRQEALKSGITAQDALMLWMARNNPGVGVTALAELEQVSRPTMSLVMKRLEEKGLVVRNPDPTDARRYGFTLSPEGEAKLDQIESQRTDWLVRQLSNLRPEERAGLAAATAVLLKMARTA